MRVFPPSGDGSPALINVIDLPITVRPEELALCDCERAMGAPHGLSCEKEGWFVTGFERKGSWVRPHPPEPQHGLAAVSM